MQHAHGGFQLCGQLCARAVGISYLELQLLFSCSVVSNSLWPHSLQHTRPPCPSPSPGACSNSCPLSQWCHLTISSSSAPFCSCPQSFPASGSFPMGQRFTSGGQSIGASAGHIDQCFSKDGLKLYVRNADSGAFLELISQHIWEQNLQSAF